MDLPRSKVATLFLLAALAALTAANSTLPPSYLWSVEDYTTDGPVSEKQDSLTTTESPQERDELILEDSNAVRNKQNQRCPTLDSSFHNPCEEKCDGDWSCSESKVCCRNSCGGTECMDPVSEELPREIKYPRTTEPPTEFGESTPIDALQIDAYDEDWLTTQEEPAGMTFTYDDVSTDEVTLGTKIKDIHSTEPPTLPADDYGYGDILAQYLHRRKQDPRCPTLDPSIKSPCSFLCLSETTCPEQTLCCRNNCGGTECMDPVSDKQLAQNEKEKIFWDLFMKNIIQQYEPSNTVDK